MKKQKRYKIIRHPDNTYNGIEGRVFFDTGKWVFLIDDKGRGFEVRKDFCEEVK